MNIFNRKNKALADRLKRIEERLGLVNVVDEDGYAYHEEIRDNYQRTVLGDIRDLKEAKKKK